MEERNEIKYPDEDLPPGDAAFDRVSGGGMVRVQLCAGRTYELQREAGPGADGEDRGGTYGGVQQRGCAG